SPWTICRSRRRRRITPCPKPATTWLRICRSSSRIRYRSITRGTECSLNTRPGAIRLRMSDAQDATDITAADDPIVLFHDWFEEAKAKEPNDPEAMALATADARGMPNVRMVLLKGADASGFVFYTNTESAKGTELAANPNAALCFHWKSLRRQVRVQ